MECNRYVSPRVAELCVSGKRFDVETERKRCVVLNVVALCVSGKRLGRKRRASGAWC